MGIVRNTIDTQELHTVVYGVITPSARAPRAVTILNTEPGGYWPCVARLCNGKCGSVLNARHVAGEGRGTKAFGSNAGWLARARIWPLRGSRATMAPL